MDTIEALNFKTRVLTEQEASADNGESKPPMSPLIAKFMDQARRDNKGLVLEFSGKFCAACRQLEKETIEHPSVQAALKNFIFRKIMVEEHPDAARQFGIYGIPQLRFFAPDGTEVAKDKGVISVETMLGHLKTLGSAK